MSDLTHSEAAAGLMRFAMLSATDPGATSAQPGRKPPPAGWFEKARKDADRIERDTGVKIDFIQGSWLEPQPKPGERWLTGDGRRPDWSHGFTYQQGDDDA